MADRSAAPRYHRRGALRGALALTALLAACSAAANPFWAAPARESGGLAPSGLAPQSTLAPTPPSGAGSLMPVERAARIARRQTGGRVLSTTRVRRDGAPGVEVRLLINGSRVTTLFVDNEGDVRER